MYTYAAVFIFTESLEVDHESRAKSSEITSADLNLLIDLFYLPYEHGDNGRALLESFRWLKENAGQLNSGYQLFNDKVTFKFINL